MAYSTEATVRSDQFPNKFFLGRFDFVKTRKVLLILILTTISLTVFFQRTAMGESVDLALVLAVDVSYSMDEDEQRLQRQGYISAITDPQILTTIKAGRYGKIAVSYVEWAGAYSQFLTIDWHVIEDEESAEVFAAALAQGSMRQIYRTSISEALEFSANLFDGLNLEPLRRTIDISGDGPNNQGRLVTEVRDLILSRNITINGLPLLMKRPEYSWFDIPNLDEYYELCVIGGPGSFSIPVRHVENFKEAIRMKLLLEVASLPTTNSPLWRDETLQLISDGNAELCTIGERLWQERMLHFDVE